MRSLPAAARTDQTITPKSKVFAGPGLFSVTTDTQDSSHSEEFPRSPISRPPPEILVSIFIYCAHSRQTNRWGVPNWVNVSYVCRHWRDVGLNCSTLVVPFPVLEALDRRVARSKTAPSRVCLDSEYSRELNLLKGVAPQVNRIQDLYLRFTRPEAERILSLLSSPGPLLQTLRISVERSNFLGETVLVSGKLFGGYTPTLRELELINYAFPLTSPTLRGSTFLRLRDLGTSFRPTLTSLMVALSRMQDLAYLHLEKNALPSARASSIDQFFQNPEKLSFPKLSCLSIIAPFTTVVLLSFFHIPLKTEVRLRCYFEAGAEDYSLIYPSRKNDSSSPRTRWSPLFPSSVLHQKTTSATVGFIVSTGKDDTGCRAFSASTTPYDLGELHED